MTVFLWLKRFFMLHLRLQSQIDFKQTTLLISHDISAIFFLLHTNFCMLFCLQRTMKCGFYLRKKNLIKKIYSYAFQLKRKKGMACEREIKQFHYTSWPDHGVPCHPLPVLSFIRNSASANPIGEFRLEKKDIF